jgi:hypothetical protein
MTAAFTSLDMGNGHTVTIDPGKSTEVKDLTTGRNAWLPRFGAITRDMVERATTRHSETAGYPAPVALVDRMWAAVEWYQNNSK